MNTPPLPPPPRPTLSVPPPPQPTTQQKMDQFGKTLSRIGCCLSLTLTPIGLLLLLLMLLAGGGGK